MTDEPVVADPAAVVEPAVAPVEPAVEPAPGVTVPTPGIGESATPTTPEVPEAYRSEDGSADVAKLLERANAADAADASRPEAATDVPTDPAGYTIGLNEEIKLFNGQNVEFNAEDPLLKEGQELVHSYGLGQEAFSKFLTFAAKMSAQNMNDSVTVTQNAVNAEIAKLGDTEEAQTARIDATRASLAIVLGNDGEAETLMNEIRTINGFKSLETLLGKMNGMGGERTPVSNGGIGQQKTLAERMNAPD